ncbi:MAG TPA: MFS transporter [Baekduia sp.]|uniref:MFS transporter n=1 Tax=Baekduia sp. TaxID=2600305 RepID=UPI002D76B371|nr:MFS transporter [Baekduia sp.]HET6509620.1 MFS transporter [Baekduia sp.]
MPSRIAVDTSSLRESRDLRLLLAGELVTGLGTQATLVALPYQLYVETRSAFLTGLLGAVELVPLMTMALLGGAFADRHDRRRMLLGIQAALILGATALAALAYVGSPPLVLLYVLGAAMAGFGAVQNVTAGSIVPNLVAPERLRSALALNYGLNTLTMVVGPGLGGVLIGVLGLGAAYTIDAASCAAILGAVWMMSPQPPRISAEAAAAAPEKVWASIRDGLRFVRGNHALMGSFAIDLVAMTFGMPRALFAVLSVSVYHTGASGTGLLYASVAAGATVAALTTGWLSHARRLGLIVIWAVVAWGVAIALAGIASSLWIAAAMLALAGAADSVSAVCRSAINQSVTPDHLRGRMSSVFTMVVTSGPRLGDVESGSVAALTSVRASVISGGLACIAGVALIVVAFPALARFDAERDIVVSPAPAA